jgi:hypothetical protein
MIETALLVAISVRELRRLVAICWPTVSSMRAFIGIGCSGSAIA